jgi:hypothetical protein
VLAGRDKAGSVRLLVANPQDVSVTVGIAGLLLTGQIEAVDKTMITITSLTETAPDLVSTSAVEFGTLGTTELEPFSVQVYEFRG